MIESYPSIYNIGHSAIADLFKNEVLVEEKVDGSQLSFRKTGDGSVIMRSKGAPINMEAPEALFAKAVETVKQITPQLRPDVTYRGEYLAKPHHNALTYSRVPRQHIIIFDVNSGLERYCDPATKMLMANAVGLETVPVLFRGKIDSPEMLRSLLDAESVLGGTKIEGVVVKPLDYGLFGRDKKVLMGKFVSEAFKEVHAATWTKEHKTPTGGDVIQIMSAALATPARWQKAVQHLRESGKLERSGRDIPLLLKEVQEDIERECMEDIRARLSQWAWPQIRRQVVRGLPEWYKDQLLQSQFEQCTPDSPAVPKSATA